MWTTISGPGGEEVDKPTQHLFESEMESSNLDGSGSGSGSVPGGGGSCTYVAQLHQVFSGCDTSGTGYLGRSELIELCSQLHLDEQSNLILGHLLGDDPEAKVDFQEFKEKFVYLLAHSVQDNETHEESSSSREDEDAEDAEEEEEAEEEERLAAEGSIPFASHDREVSPKYIWGSKKYGRRSRPDGGDGRGGGGGGGGGDDSDDATDDFPLSDVSDSEVFVDQSPIEEQHRTGSSSVEVDSNSVSTASATGTVVTLSTVRPRASSFGGKSGAKRRRRMRSSEETKLFASDDVAVNSSNTEEEDNEEEYLRSIWLKLGVRTDGFLDQEGLTQVCEHIGMEKMSEEVVAQLFEKLDVDRDGRIHFDEFLHLFRTGEATATTGLPNNVPHNQSPIGPNKLDNDSVPHSERQTSTSSSINGGVTSTGGIPNESGIFSSIDLYNTGYAEPEAIWELWDSLGITDGYTILKELGFCTNSRVCLLDLTNVFEEILQNPSDVELSHVAFLTYNYELKFLRRTVNQLKLERDYLLMDVADANSRATLIAQEVDENQAKLEQKSQETIVNLGRKYREQMRRLKEELDSEQEQWSEQILKLKRELQEELNARQELEGRHREHLGEVEKEMMELNKEKQNLEKRLSEVERDSERRLEAMCRLRPKDEEKSYEGQCHNLTIELETYKSINKQLQDKNDELNARVEQLENQFPSKLSLEVLECRSKPKMTTEEEDEELDEEGLLQCPSKGHRRTGSCLSDYIKTTTTTRTSSPPTIEHRRGSANVVVTSVAGEEEEQLIRTEEVHQQTNDKVEFQFDAEVSSPEEETVPSSSLFLVANDLSGDEEYLTYQPKTTLRTVLLPIDVQDGVKRLQVKQVFSVLKQRFIENYLEETENATTDYGGAISRDVRLRALTLPTSSQKKESSERLINENTSENVSIMMDITFDDIARSLQSTVLETPVKVSSDSGFHDINSNATTPLTIHCGGLSPTIDNCGIEEDVCARTLAEDVDHCHIPDRGTNEAHSVMVCMQQQWQTELEGERERWIKLVLNMESDQKELQEKLIKEEVSHKSDVLRSEVFWREQVEQERLEQEQERVDLVDKILALELQLENAKKKQRSRVKRDLSFDEDDGGGRCGKDSVRRSKSWREYSTTSLQNTESTRRCLSGKMIRDRWAKKPEETSLDTDSSEDHSGNELLTKTAHNCGKHKVSCCAKLNLYKSQLRNSGKEIESLTKEIQRLQREFLTRGTSLRLETSSERPNCVVDVEMLHAINQHVKQQEQRCRQLEATMATKTLQTTKELRDTRHAYEEELRRVMQMLSKTKGLLKENTLKAREQNEKLLQSDLLIKELYIENAQLMKTVQMLEEKNEIMKKSNLNLQQKYLTLNKLLTEMCRVPPPPPSSTTSSST